MQVILVVPIRDGYFGFIIFPLSRSWLYFCMTTTLQQCCVKTSWTDAHFSHGSVLLLFPLMRITESLMYALVNGPQVSLEGIHTGSSWLLSGPFSTSCLIFLTLCFLLLVKQNFGGKEIFFFQRPTCWKPAVRLTWTIVILMDYLPSFKCLQCVRCASLKCSVDLKMFSVRGSNPEVCTNYINALP